MFEYDRLALDVAQQFTQQSPKTATSLLTSVFGDSVTPRKNCHSETDRRLSGGSAANEPIDCGASSGYGSPGFGGTPLASPAPNSVDSQIAAQLHRMLCDQGFDEDLPFGSPTNLTVGIGAKRSLGKHSMRPLQPHYFNHQQQIPMINGLTFEQIEKCNDRGNEENRPFSSASSLSSNETSTNSTASSKNSPTVVENGSAKIDVPVPPVAVEDGFSPDEIAQFAQLLCSPKKAPPQRYQCHICYQSGHYISDCPMRFNSPYEELTPYQGRKKCYGEFQCQQCKRKWTSQNSVANEAQSCIKCHVPVFPHKQLPVDKAVALGLVKLQKTVATKPIGHGRPPFAETASFPF